MASEASAVDSSRIHYFDLKPPPSDMRAEVLAGLGGCPKSIPPKYFYDERGSKLFDQITELPEYYPTRTELSLFRNHAHEMVADLGEDVLLVEYGSGSSEKIRLLLDVLRPAGYMPLDISGEHLQASAERLADDFEWLHLYPTCADYTGEIRLPEVLPEAPRVGFFPGSSIGNFTPEAAQEFLARVRETVGDSGSLLIGVDRKKDAAILTAAYNDAAGVTAEFNLNVLRHINEELEGTFDLDNFEHVALYNEALGRIEMHLEVNRDATVSLANAEVEFASGERVHTESSYKYHPAEFETLAGSSGFTVANHWTDHQSLFSVFLLAAA